MPVPRGSAYRSQQRSQRCTPAGAAREAKLAARHIMRARNQAVAAVGERREIAQQREVARKVVRCVAVEEPGAGGNAGGSRGDTMPMAPPTFLVLTAAARALARASVRHSFRTWPRRLQYVQSPPSPAGRRGGDRHDRQSGRHKPRRGRACRGMKSSCRTCCPRQLRA